jgi:hypothetical protein
MVVGVRDGGTVAEILRSIMALPSGGAEAFTLFMPAPPTVDNGVTPSVRP